MPPTINYPSLPERLEKLAFTLRNAAHARDCAAARLEDLRKSLEQDHLTKEDAQRRILREVRELLTHCAERDLGVQTALANVLC